MDRFESMALLVEVVDAGTMSAASRKLAMPLATLSRKIAELEAHLGVRLLARSTRRLDLTDAGASYLAASRRILEQVDDAEREALGEYLVPRGELVLTASLAFGRRHVLPVVNAFMIEHSDITVRLGLSDHNLDLVESHIDLAVRIGELRDSNLIARRVGHLRWVIVGSPALIAARGAPRTPDELLDWPCVGIDFLQLSSRWHFRSPATSKDVDVAIRPRLAVTTGEGAVDAAVAGVGLTQTTLDHAAPAIADGRLQVVLAEFEATPLPLSIVYTGGGRMPLKTRAFLDFAVPRLAADLTRLDSLSPMFER